jgi:hypothetical protein
MTPRGLGSEGSPEADPYSDRVVHPEGHKETPVAVIPAPPIDLTGVAGRAGLERPTQGRA